MSKPSSSKGPFVDPGVCRCCGFKKKCRILDVDYEYQGHTETYAGMILNCFGLVVTNLETELSDKLICATCVMRLRESVSFRQQIINCEAQLVEKHAESTSYTESTNLRTRNVPCQQQMALLDDSISEIESVKTEVLMVGSSDGHGSDSDHLADDYDDDVSDPEYQPEPEEAPKRATLKRTAKKTTGKITAKMNKNIKLKRIKAIGATVKKSTNQYTSGQMETKELKQMLLARLHKLKSMATPVAYSDVHNRPRRMKDLQVFENTCKIVNASFVCPFNNIIGTFHCYYCKSAFIKPEELRDHTMTSHNPEEFSRLWPKMKAIKIDISRIDCRLCDTKISELDELKKHLTEAHNLSIHQDIKNEFLKFKICEENLVCLECGAGYLFIDKLIEHMAVHFGTHVCDYCGVGFVQLSSLIAHVRGHKSVNKDYPCPVCLKNLRTARSRWQHMMVVHEKKPVIKCIKCTETFLSYERRDIHLRDDHGDARSYPCQECGKVFDIRRRYMSHVKSVHLKSYKLQCNLCERRFCKPRDLKNHVLSHAA